MPLSGTYLPSTADWAREQVEAFEASNGSEANELRGVPIIVITSKGARSGGLRKNPVMRVEHEGQYAAIASKGGADEHPAWHENLVAHPEVELQDGADKRDYSVHLAQGEEREAWWQRAVAVWPDYDEYQQKTDREIPVFVLTPKI